MSVTELTPFAKRLRRLMDEQELTQADVAGLLKVEGVPGTISSVSQWFTQQRIPEGRTIVVLARRLGTTVPYLAEGRGPRYGTDAPLDRRLLGERLDAISDMRDALDGLEREALRQLAPKTERAREIHEAVRAAEAAASEGPRSRRARG